MNRIALLLAAAVSLLVLTGCAGMGTGAEKAQRIADITGVSVRDVVGDKVADVGQAGQDYCTAGNDPDTLQPSAREFFRERLGCNLDPEDWPADAPPQALEQIERVCDGGDELCAAAEAIDWQE